MRQKENRDKDRAIKSIVWMARRYCEGRRTGAPGMFNDAYNELKKTIDFDEKNDPDNRKGGPISNFPYATSGLDKSENPELISNS